MDEKFKEDEYIENLISKKIKVNLTLDNNFHYTGFIVGMSKNSILFRDKFDQEHMFFIKDIRRILTINNHKKVKEKNS